MAHVYNNLLEHCNFFFVSEKTQTAVHCAPQFDFPFIALNAFAAITLAQ